MKRLIYAQMMTKSENLHIKSFVHSFARSYGRCFCYCCRFLLLKTSFVDVFICLRKRFIEKQIKPSKAKQSNGVANERSKTRLNWVAEMFYTVPRFFAKISHFSRSVYVSVCYRLTMRRLRIIGHTFYAPIYVEMKLKPFWWNIKSQMEIACVKFAPLQKLNGVPFITISPAYGVWLLFAW